MFPLQFYLYSAVTIALFLAVLVSYFLFRLQKERAKCASEMAQSRILRESVNLKLQRETQENVRLQKRIESLEHQIAELEARLKKG